MKRRTRLLLFFVLAWPQFAFAQQAGDSLTEQQRLGRRILAQSCGICHLPPSLKAQTYGPSLNKQTADGDDALIRSTVLDGTARMPAFKYYLQRNEIDAIIAYLKTIPAPTAAPAAR